MLRDSRRGREKTGCIYAEDEMTWATKVRIMIAAILFGIAIFMFLQWWAIRSVRNDVKGIPETFDSIEREINWRKI